MEDLTPRQKEILEFIREEVERCNYPPAVREICRKLGFSSSSTAHAHLEALQKKGYIRRNPTKPRAIELLGEAKRGMSAGSGCTFAPMVGRITAGLPVLAEENVEGYFPLPPEMTAGGTAFVLRVEGDSMVNAGIMHGDFVVVRKQETAENGDIVVALLEEEATVKRFFREKNGIRLQPENDAYAPIVSRQVQVLGKVVGLFRKL